MFSNQTHIDDIWGIFCKPIVKIIAFIIFTWYNKNKEMSRGDNFEKTGKKKLEKYKMG